MGILKGRPPRSGFSHSSLQSSIKELLPILQWLDQQLATAIDLPQTESDAAEHPYRGLLQPSRTEVEQILSCTPGTMPLAPPTPEAAATIDILEYIEPGSPLAWLQETFELSAFDVAVMAIALAPELDQGYERIYSHLQDDIRCQRPTVDLALNLLCPSAHEKLMRRVHFTHHAPLIRHQLLHRIIRSDQHQPTLLRQELHLDQQVIHLLLGQPEFDQRLSDYCQFIQPEPSLNQSVSPDLPFLSPQQWAGLVALTSQYWQSARPLRLYFQGSDALTKQRTAEALARTIPVSLLRVDLSKLASSKTNLESALSLIYREAWFQQACLYFESLDSLQAEAMTAYQFLLTTLAEHPGIVILSGSQPWTPAASQPLGTIQIAFPPPDFEQRRTCWQRHLTAAGITLAPADLDALSDRFQLTANQIADAVITACNIAHWQTLSTTASSPNPSRSDLFASNLFAAARAQSSHDLAALARKIEPRYGWDDLVLPDAPWNQLQELANQAKNRSIVYRDWEFDRKLSLGKGLNALFSGPPGTGKTMAAEVIANVLQLDLYKIDLSQVVSKYIGETEKSLNRIFTAAAASNAILLFDEADALFGKRSEVRDAHDRYANIETSYLLQKMEEYDGISILTTNLRSNLDEAFTRRLQFIIDFPFPGTLERRQIWQQVWTSATPLDAHLDWDFLARRFEITGANIRNIALTAAFFAAEDTHIIQMDHLLQAVQREYQKMGKFLMIEE